MTEAGEIRPGLVDEDFIEWSSTIILKYAAREDISPHRLRTLVQNYLVPIVANEH